MNGDPDYLLPEDCGYGYDDNLERRWYEDPHSRSWDSFKAKAQWLKKIGLNKIKFKKINKKFKNKGIDLC